MTHDDGSRCDTLPDGPTPEDAARWLKREIGSGRFTREELLRLMGFFIKAMGMKSLTVTMTLSVNNGSEIELDKLHVEE